MTEEVHPPNPLREADQLHCASTSREEDTWRDLLGPTSSLEWHDISLLPGSVQYREPSTYALSQSLFGHPVGAGTPVIPWLEDNSVQWDSTASFGRFLEERGAAHWMADHCCNLWSRLVPRLRLVSSALWQRLDEVDEHSGKYVTGFETITRLGDLLCV